MASKKNQKGRGKGSFTPKPMGRPAGSTPPALEGSVPPQHGENPLGALFPTTMNYAPVPKAAAGIIPVSQRPAAVAVGNQVVINPTAADIAASRRIAPPDPPRSIEAIQHEADLLAEETSAVMRRGGMSEEAMEPMRRFLEQNALLGFGRKSSTTPERPMDTIALVGTFTPVDVLNDAERTAMLQEFIQDHQAKNASEAMLMRRLEIMRSLAQEFDVTLTRSENTEQRYKKRIEAYIEHYGLPSQPVSITISPTRELFDMVRRLLPRTRMAYMWRLGEWTARDIDTRLEKGDLLIEPLTAQEISQPPFFLDPIRAGYTSLDLLVEGLEGLIGEDLGVMAFTVMAHRTENGPLEKALLFCQFALSEARGGKEPILVFNRPLFAGDPLIYSHEKIYIHQMRMRWDERLDRSPAWARMALVEAQRVAQPDTHFSTQMMVVRERGTAIPDQPEDSGQPVKWMQLHTAMTFEEQSDAAYLYKDAPVFSLLRGDGAYESYHIFGAEGAALALPTRPTLLHPYWKYLAERTVKTQDEQRYAMSDAVRANDPILVVEREDGSQIPIAGFYSLFKASQLGMTMVSTKILSAGESARYRILLPEGENVVDRPDMGPLSALLPKLRAHQMRGDAGDKAKRLMAQARARGGTEAVTHPIRQELWDIMVSPDREIQPRLAVEIKDYLVVQAAQAEEEGALMSAVFMGCDLVLWTNTVYEGATRGNSEAFTGYTVDFKEVKIQPQFWLYAKPRLTEFPETGERIMDIGVLVYSADAFQKMIRTPIQSNLRGLARVSLLAPDITVSVDDPNMPRFGKPSILTQDRVLSGGLDTEVYSALRFLQEPFVGQRKGELSKKFTERYQKEKKVNTIPTVSIIYLRRPEAPVTTRKRSAPAEDVVDVEERREISVSYIARGHWRRLESERYTHKRGEVVYVRPSLRGAGKPFKAGEGSIYLANR